MTSEKPEITETVNEQMPFGATLGVRTFGDARRGRRDARVLADLCTAAGVLHGGVLMTLADYGRSRVRVPGTCRPGARTVTIESKTNFLGAVRNGTGDARGGAPLHLGKTTIVVETDVFDASGRRVARTTQTQAVLAATEGTARAGRYPVAGAVAVAQLVEPRVVVPVVAGWSPVRHP